MSEYSLNAVKFQEAIFVQINFAGRMNFMSAVLRPGRDPRRAWHPPLPFLPLFQ